MTSASLVFASHWAHKSSTTHLYVGIFLVIVFFISLLFVYILAQRFGAHSLQTNFFGPEEGASKGSTSSHSSHRISQCFAHRWLHPFTQKSSHFIPQQTIST